VIRPVRQVRCVQQRTPEPMTSPTVTETNVPKEPVVRDPFIDDVTPTAAPTPPVVPAAGPRRRRIYD
jgi:hypothetical protein